MPPPSRRSHSRKVSEAAPESLTTHWANPSVESILTSRFILNLRLLDIRDDELELSSINIPGLPTISQGPAQSGRFSALDFGNIGAPLDFDEEPDEDEQLGGDEGNIRVERR